jgi:hypothetical protein
MITGFIGKMGSGKTLSMVREALKYYVKGYRILSNFHLKIPYEPINFDELYAMAENQKSLQNVVLLLDEVHILLDSRSSVSKVSKIMTFWLNQTRKMGVKLFFTTQYLHQVDKRLRSGTDMVAQCDGIKVIKGGKEYFICMNMITDQDSIVEDIFLGDPFFKYYDTNEVIGFLSNKEVGSEV